MGACDKPLGYIADASLVSKVSVYRSAIRARRSDHYGARADLVLGLWRVYRFNCGVTISPVAGGVLAVVGLICFAGPQHSVSQDRP